MGHRGLRDYLLSVRNNCAVVVLQIRKAFWYCNHDRNPRVADSKRNCNTSLGKQNKTKQTNKPWNPKTPRKNCLSHAGQNRTSTEEEVKEEGRAMKGKRGRGRRSGRVGKRQGDTERKVEEEVRDGEKKLEIQYLASVGCDSHQNCWICWIHASSTSSSDSNGYEA